MKFNNQEIQQPGNVDLILRAADDFVDENKDVVYCTESQTFYVWRENYFNEMLKIEFEKYLLEYNEVFTHHKLTALNNFIHRVATLTQKRMECFNQKDIIDLKNGIYDIESDSFKKHDRSYMSTTRIPYNYDLGARCPVWLSFLETSLESDRTRISILQEFMGYCLGRDNAFHKALVLTGEGRNGKGTTFYVLEKLVGKQNTSALGIGQMVKQETISTLVNKLINIDADTDASAVGYESAFRRIVAGDPIVAKILYKDPFMFTPYVKLVIGANELPRIADKTRGFYDRLLIIPYNVSFYGREDFHLKPKLAREISGIFNWALEGRKRLYDRGRFEMSNDMISAVSQLRMENNPVEHFSIDNITESNGESLIKKEVYVKYTSWCRENGHKPLSMIKFGKEFYRVNREHTRPNYRSGGIDNFHAWPNLGWKYNGVGQKVVEWEE